MKKLFGKRFHRIPVALVAIMLAVVLVAGGVFGAYSFKTVTVDTKVEEAIVLGLWDTWDNLVPYGSVDDVEITLGGSAEAPTVSITTIPGYAGAGFVAGESIVIPVNFRNAGDGELTLGAAVINGDGLTLECSFEPNLGPETSVESGQSMCREYIAVGTFGSLDEWTGTIAGKGGKSGSAVVYAEVLFVKVSVPEDAPPGDYTFSVEFTRG